MSETLAYRNPQMAQHMKYLPDLSDQPYDRQQVTFSLRLIDNWTCKEKNLIFLIKILELLTS